MVAGGVDRGCDLHFCPRCGRGCSGGLFGAMLRYASWKRGCWSFSAICFLRCRCGNSFGMLAAQLRPLEPLFDTYPTGIHDTLQFFNIQLLFLENWRSIGVLHLQQIEGFGRHKYSSWENMMRIKIYTQSNSRMKDAKNYATTCVSCCLVGQQPKSSLTFEVR